MTIKMVDVSNILKYPIAIKTKKHPIFNTAYSMT